MINTRIVLIPLVLWGATALAAPGAQGAPSGNQPAQAGQSARGPVMDDRKPESWTWFGMGFESRRAWMHEDDDHLDDYVCDKSDNFAVHNNCLDNHLVNQ